PGSLTWAFKPMLRMSGSAAFAALDGGAANDIVLGQPVGTVIRPNSGAVLIFGGGNPPGALPRLVPGTRPGFGRMVMAAGTVNAEGKAGLLLITDSGFTAHPTLALRYGPDLATDFWSRQIALGTGLLAGPIAL